jgi:hypothetical protein
VDVRLPVARTLNANQELTVSASTLNATGSSSFDSSEARERSSESSSSSQQSAEFAQAASSSSESSSSSSTHIDQTVVDTENIVADHVVINSGNQTITDATFYSVLLDGNAQQDAVALNIFNAAGRNNIAAAWNFASSDEPGVINVGGNLTQLNTIKQTN